MQHQSLLRHFQGNQHINNNHPTHLARILFFIIPNAFFLIVSFMIIRRSIDVTGQYRVYTLPRNGALLVLSCIYLATTLIVSGYAVFEDAWTTKQWIIFTQICLFEVLAHILYASTHKLGLHSMLGAALAGFITFVLNQWLFACLVDMGQDNIPNHSNWKTAIRIFQGLRTTFTLFQTFELISQLLVHQYELSHIKQIFFFWIATLLALITLIIVNSIAYGPFLHVLGFIVGGFMFITPAVRNTYRFFSGQQIKV